MDFSYNDLLAGLDEAGKGALIGPMVLATVYIPVLQIEELVKTYHLRDSKLLSNKRISYIYNQLKHIPHAFSIVTPLEIDNMNLNTLLIQKYSELVNALPVNAHVYIDCPLHSPALFNLQIYKRTTRRIFSEHKADSKYGIVSLAAIFAKAKREEEVANLKHVLGLDIGSGYPADPKTKLCYKTQYAKIKPYIRQKWNIKG